MGQHREKHFAEALLLLIILLLVSAAAGFSVAAFAAPADTASQVVGTGERARTIGQLLDGGEYVEGRVLARVSDEYAPISTFSDEQASTVSDLYTFSSSSVDASAAGDVASASTGTGATGTGDASAGKGATAFSFHAPDRIILIQSDTLTTKELLESLVNAAGVVSAQPDYIRTLDDGAASSQSAQTDDAASSQNAQSDDAASALASGSLSMLLGDDASAQSSDAAASTFASSVPNDMFFNELYSLKDASEAGTSVRALWDKLWNSVPTSANVEESKQVIIAVMDSGVEYDHVDLAGVMWRGGDALAAKGIASGTYGYDFVGNDTDPMDKNGHGSLVAGVVAASVNNGTGVAGIAPNARIMALRTGDSRGMNALSATIAAYSYLADAAQAGVHVAAVNDSWGDIGGDGLLVEVVDDLYETYGTISVAASGNDSYDTDAVGFFPSSLPTDGIISVNATDEVGKLASFSDYGAMTTDIGAPGVAILSTSSKIWFVIGLADKSKLAVYETFDNVAPYAFEAAWAGSPDMGGTLKISSDADSSSSGTGAGIEFSVTDAQSGASDAITLTSHVDLSGAVNKPTDVVFDSRQFDDADDAAVRITRVYMASTLPGEWVELSSFDSGATRMNWGFHCFFIPAKQSDQIDWKKPTIKIERKLTDFDAGKDITYQIDNVGLAFDGACEAYPYFSDDGTSLAAPMVTGAIALLAAAYPDDSPATLKNRLLGSVTRSDALAGTCTSDGRLDLSRTDNPYPVVSTVEQDASDTRVVTVSGSFFGNAVGGVSVEGVDDGQVAITSWGDSQITLALPAGLQAANRYVTVTRASDSDTGRRLVALKGTAEADSTCFDELPAPDLGSLGLSRTQSEITSWQMASAGGKIYAVSSGVGKAGRTGGGVVHTIALLSYDPQARTWTDMDAFDDVAMTYVLMCAYGNNLYIYDAGVDILYRFDTETGVRTTVAHYSSDPAFSGVDYTNASMVSDGLTVTLVGSRKLVNGAYDHNQPTLSIDLSTGAASLGTSLAHSRIWPVLGYLDGVLFAAAGGTAAQTPATSVEILANGAYSAVASMPDGILASQLSTAAGSVLPAGFRFVAADGSTVELAHDCLAVSGLVNSSGKNSADTYIFDPQARTWTTTARILAPVKVSYAGGAYLNGKFYVLGYDGTGNIGNGYGLVFRCLASAPVDPDPTPTPTPDPDPTPVPDPNPAPTPDSADVAGDGAGGGSASALQATYTANAPASKTVADTSDSTTVSIAVYALLVCAIAAFALLLAAPVLQRVSCESDKTR